MCLTSHSPAANKRPPNAWPHFWTKSQVTWRLHRVGARVENVIYIYEFHCLRAMDSGWSVCKKSILMVRVCALQFSILFYLQTWKDEWLPAELWRGGEQGESVLLPALTTPLPILTTTTKPLWGSPASPRLFCQLPQQSTSQPHQSCG